VLAIRREQEQALSRVSAGRFEERAVVHLLRCWPRECGVLGDEGVRARVRDGAGRAETYGVRSERDVIRFLDLTFLLAPDFDTNPRAPWARQILTEPGTRPGARMDRIWARARTDLAARRPRGGRE
jgi:hypothetical protein